MRLGVLTSHPIQYQAPWFRGLAQQTETEVFFAHRQTAAEQGSAGFGVAFDWDVDLLAGYQHRFLENKSPRRGVNHFSGCDTPEIRNIIRDGKFDAFITTGWYLKSYWQAVSACRATKTPVLVRGDSQLGTRRSLVKRALKHVTYSVLLDRFDGFLVVGQRSREYLKYYGVKPEQMFPAPHFVDNDWFAAHAIQGSARRAFRRAAWGADADTVVALFVGKLQAIKRPGDILIAVQRLKGRGINTAIVFVGAGELEKTLRTQAHSLGLRAFFEGFKNQTELSEFYCAADFLVLPSESETWGLVVNEAMACGLPAIVSDQVGCAPDLIDSGQTGFTFEVGDTAALADRMAELAKLRQSGYDFKPILDRKLSGYSLSAAVEGTLRAARTLMTQRDG